MMPESLAQMGTRSYGPTGDEDLENLLRRKGIVPTEEQAHDCYLSLSILRNTLLGDDSTEIATDISPTFMSTVQGVTLILAPTGAYPLGCWDTTAVISCSMAGTPSEETFYDLALQRLRRAHDIIITSIDETGPIMFRISIKGCGFGIQYHQSPYTKCWNEMSTKGLEENISLAPSAKRRFNAYRDTLHMRSMIRNRNVFIYAYLAIKFWARCHGIFSETFGFLDETTLLYMVAKASSHPNVVLDATATQIVLNFFNYFGSLQLSELVVGEITPRPEKSKTSSKPRHGIVVYSYHSPSYDLSNVKITAHAEIIQREIIRCKSLMQSEWNWEALLGRAQKKTSTDRAQQHSFIHKASPLLDIHLHANDYAAFIKVEAAYWGASTIGKGRYFEAIEALTAEFARKISMKQAPGFSARPWPVRLRRQQDTETDTPGSYHDAYYLIGLRISSDPSFRLPTACSSRTDIQAVKAALHEDITDLETRITSMKLDHHSSYFTVSLVLANEVEEKCVEDDRSWGPIPIDEAELDDLVDDDPTSDEPQPTKPKSNATAESSGKRDAGVETREDSVRSSLRPALDVLNRLRFDDKYAVDDYMIGYEDRHAGIVEMPVTSWKSTDSTMEDFIPQSRIVYYKRNSDGVEVWNRRERLDAIFGSGAR